MHPANFGVSKNCWSGQAMCFLSWATYKQSPSHLGALLSALLLHPFGRSKGVWTSSREHVRQDKARPSPWVVGSLSWIIKLWDKKTSIVPPRWMPTQTVTGICKNHVTSMIGRWNLPRLILPFSRSGIETRVKIPIVILADTRPDLL